MIHRPVKVTYICRYIKHCGIKIKTVEFANSLDLDPEEAALNETFLLDLHCLSLVFEL